MKGIGLPEDLEYQKVLVFYRGLKAVVCFGLWDAQDSPRTLVVFKNLDIKKENF